MLHRFTHIETPFGNFAAQTYQRDDWTDDKQQLMITPIGQLTELPLKTFNALELVGLDEDKIEAEARRQHPDWPRSHFIKPRAHFEINRKRYTDPLIVEYGTHGQYVVEHLRGTEYARVFSYSILSDGLSPSAQTKLAAWMLEHRDEIMSRDFLARDAAYHATRDRKRAEKDLEAARNALQAATIQAEAASEAERAAMRALTEA